MKTVSVPSGIGAPVKMRTASPGFAASAAPPAATRPFTGNAFSVSRGKSLPCTA